MTDREAFLAWRRQTALGTSPDEKDWSSRTLDMWEGWQAAIKQERERYEWRCPDHPDAQVLCGEGDRCPYCSLCGMERHDSLRARSEPHPPWCSGGCCADS